MVNYTLYKRQKTNGSFFYVVFKDERTGKNGTAKSIDALAKELGLGSRHIAKKPEAIEIIQKAIEAGVAGSSKRTDPTFVSFCLDFWDWDGEYIQTELKLNPDSINKDYCRNSQRNIENWVKKYIPADLRCSQVTTDDIERIQKAVLKDYSGQTWKNVLNSIRKPITELRRKKILLSDPLFDLRSVKARSNTVSVKGALTKRETDLLLFQMYKDSTEGRDIEVESKSRTGNKYTYPKKFKLDRRVYLATALSAVSGMRQGEILALKADAIRFPNAQDKAEDMAIVDVSRNFARQAGFKCPKNGKPRQVVIPRWLAEELVDFAETNPWGNGLVFYSDLTAETPIDHKVVTKWFNFELDFIKVDRTGRNITFHSLRHYFDTMSLDAIGGELTRNLMGHSSEAMTQLYFNVTDEQLIDAGRKTTLFVSNPKTAKPRKAKEA